MSFIRLPFVIELVPHGTPDRTPAPEEIVVHAKAFFRFTVNVAINSIKLLD